MNNSAANLSSNQSQLIKMGDKIKFILNTSGKMTANFWSENFSEKLSPFSADYFNSPPVEDDTLIREFFGNEELTILAATCVNHRIRFLHELPQNSEFSLVFYKIPRNDPPTNAADTQIGLLTLEGGMVKSIYNSVSQVFSAHSSKVIKFGQLVKQFIWTDNKSRYNERENFP